MSENVEHFIPYKRYICRQHVESLKGDFSGSRTKKKTKKQKTT